MDGSDTHEGHDYELIVKGTLDERFGSLFGAMCLTHIPPKTVLCGHVRDQAELHGFIERIEELGLEILAIRQAHDADAGAMSSP